MKAKSPLVSIIILNFNGLKDTVKCVKSLKKTIYRNLEVILVDNGSRKYEAQKLKKYQFAKTKIFRLEKNLGFTGGNNWALDKTNGKYVVLLNNDAVVTQNWLKPLVDLMERDSKVAVAQPKILSMNRKTHFDYAGAAGGYIDKYGYPFTRGRIFNTLEKDNGQYDGTTRIFWASGSACIVRKSVINKVHGLFSENLFNYMEEIDFCWRVWNRGYKVMFTSNSVVYHKVAATAGKNLVKKRFWEHRNNLFILTRNLDRNNLLKILIPRFLLELSTYLGYLLRGEFKNIFSLVLAHLDYTKRFIFIRYKRNRLPNKNNLPIYQGSIVLDHFIKKIKTFEKLNWSPKGNLAFIIFHNVPSGGLKMIFEFSNQLKDRGYGIKIYSLFDFRPPSWYPLKVKFGNILSYYFNSPPDMTISTFWPTSYASLFLRAKSKFYFIQCWERSFYKSIILKKLVSISFRLPLNIITVNKFIKKGIASSANKPNIKILKTPIVDKNVFFVKSTNKLPRAKNPRYSRSLNKTKRKIDKKIKVLSVISRYSIHKGPDILDSAVREIKKRYDNYEFTLVSYEDKPYSSAFDKFYSQLEPKDVANLYRDSDVLLITSRSEGLLGVGLEAMACGCPVITTNAPGVIDYTKHLHNAYVINDISLVWKKNLIYNILSNSKEKDRLIKNGIKTAQEYTIEKATKNFEGLFFNQQRG